MLVKHTFQITARCPVDQGPDVYDATVEARRVIRVEDIIEAVRELTAEPDYQENITAALARRLGATVTTVGYHSGIRTEVTA